LNFGPATGTAGLGLVIYVLGLKSVGLVNNPEAKVSMFHNIQSFVSCTLDSFSIPDAKYLRYVAKLS